MHEHVFISSGRLYEVNWQPDPLRKQLFIDDAKRSSVPKEFPVAHEYKRDQLKALRNRNRPVTQTDLDNEWAHISSSLLKLSLTGFSARYAVQYAEAVAMAILLTESIDVSARLETNPLANVDAQEYMNYERMLRESRFGSAYKEISLLQLVSAAKFASLPDTIRFQWYTLEHSVPLPKELKGIENYVNHLDKSAIGTIQFLATSAENTKKRFKLPQDS